MTMLISHQGFAFEHPGTRKIRYRFELAWMRRFGKRMSQFYFECGRKCPNGEGEVRCKTESAKMIHKIVTDQSSSKGKTVVPHEPPVVETQLKIPLAITNPSLALNASRKHPGQKTNPTLIPINKMPESTEEAHTTPPLKKASGKSVMKEDCSEHDRKNGPVFDMAKKLEEKLSIEEGNPGSFKRSDESKTSRSKDDKKKGKEEKKERERREKEEKKEREKREKEEKKERERKEKESKKKGKKMEDNVPNLTLVASVRCRNNNYDEPEIKPSDMDDGEVLYDEADKSLGEYAEPYQIKKQQRNTSDTLVYDEAKPRGSLHKPSETPAEYAQPYSKKHGNQAGSGGNESYVYATPQENNAWKYHGRDDEEDYFEENYSNLKNARQEGPSIPPLPTRGYSSYHDDEDEDDDDTYNRLDLKYNSRAKLKVTENLYGEASARKVVSSKQVLPFRRGGDSDSEGEEEDELEESPYDAPGLEGYEDPQELRNSAKSKPVVEAYEEAVLTKSVRPKQTSREPLYEEI